MKKLLIISLLLAVLFWPKAEVEAQFDDDCLNYWETQAELDDWSESLNVSDTMTLEEAIDYRQKCLGTPEFNKQKDFVLTRTKISADLNAGIYWPDGTTVSLPKTFLPGLVSFEAKNCDPLLSFVTKDSNGDYSIFYLHLPVEFLKKSLPEKVEIKPLLY